jgi:predicted RNase H-like HicB family nuclease
MREERGMSEGARYAKVIAWSPDDGCFVGSAPGLFFGGCHGSNEIEVFLELCALVEETIELHRRDGIPLPPANVSVP